MWGQHLKQRGRWWHYYRAVPRDFHDVEQRKLISFSLKTQDFSEAKLKAAQISLELEREWAEARARGVSLVAQDLAERYRAAADVQTTFGFVPKSAAAIPDEELLDRLRLLLSSGQPASEQRALLGLVEQPGLTMADAFDRFWEHIQDEWMRLSHDQQRVKRNIYLKAMRNFEAAVGKVGLYDLERCHALKFRSWWLERVKTEGLKPYTGNREINSLRRLVSVNFDIDSSEKQNPFARVRLKDEAQVTRVPLEVDQIRAIIAPGALDGLHEDFQLLVRLLVNTGMRPVEAIGLMPDEIVLDHEVPHVHVRKNAVRGLKTDHSERLLPLLGVSLDAARQLAAMGGWGKRAGKNMYATSIINRHFRESGLVTESRQSLYSLRHWFQDQLTKRDVVDRAQAQLMGHKFHRPKYGYGKDLAELRAIIEPFAIEG